MVCIWCVYGVHLPYPGRKFSMRISAVATSSLISCWPSGLRRSMQTDSLFRDCACHQRDVPVCNIRHFLSGSPTFGASTLTIVAPKSAKVLEAKGLREVERCGLYSGVSTYIEQ